jgi:hypothetical protein
LNRNPFALAEGDLVQYQETNLKEPLIGIVTEVEHRYPRDMYGNGNCIEQEWARVIFPGTTIWINADYLERNPCKSSAVKV